MIKSTALVICIDLILVNALYLLFYWYFNTPPPGGRGSCLLFGGHRRSPPAVGLWKIRCLFVVIAVVLPPFFSILCNKYQ